MTKATARHILVETQEECTLKTFCESREVDKDADGDILALLVAKTDEKHWLAASLDKMIRMQQGL